ncbi:MAG: hypothetical protein JWO32_2463 [Bacteroidetes bacterium]|nr:hypothetical protein [Bacteroidota bacterium]
MAAISVYSQDEQAMPAGKVNNVERNAQRLLKARMPEPTVNTHSTASPAIKHTATNAKTASPPVGTWGIIAGSRNAYGVITSQNRPLNYNSAINAISFIHRCSPTYIGSPADNSGSMVAEISTDWGVTFDSTCIWSDGTYLARHPQGGIFNPPGNTNISNAYVVGMGPALNGADFNGNWFASKQLGVPGSTVYNTSASAAAGAMQYISATPITNTMVGRADFAQVCFSSTNDGKVRALSQIFGDVTATTETGQAYRGINIVKGTFNSGVFNWTGDSLMFDPIVRTRSDGPANLHKMATGEPLMAWNEAGTVGYAVVVGVRAVPTNSQSSGYQPIVWKTTNSGASWSTVPAIDFASPTFSNVLKRIDPTTTNTNVTIPQFNSIEGYGAVVDANGLLHFVSTVINTSNSNPDSVGYSQTYTMSVNSATATYNWPHVKNKRPYIYDFITDGLTWFYKKVDSMSTEAPSGTPGSGGYDENPFAVDGGTKFVTDARIQAGRTPDGKYVFVSWSETDTNFVTGSLKYNINPDIKVRSIDVIGTPTTSPGGNGAYYVMPTEFNISAVGNNSQIKGKSVMHYMSSTSSSITVSGNTASVTIPFTVTHSDGAAPPAIPFESISGNAHYFIAAKLNLFTIGIKENALGSVSNSYVYPNPASQSAILSINMKDNALVNVDIYNTIGQQVKSSKHTAQVGENNLNIDLSNLSAGIYLVNVKVGNATSTKKLIVQ